MRRRLLTGAVSLLLVAAVGLAVLFYNTWSYCCGECTLNSFFDPGPFGLLLIGFDLLAALVLLVLRRRCIKMEECSHCGTPLFASWQYCPTCGLPLPPVSEPMVE